MGRLRRLHRLAQDAIEQYDLDEPLIEFHVFETNLLYRVTTRSGTKYILRLASPGWRTLSDLESESMWLDALRRDTDIPVPRVIRTRSGDGVFPAAMPEVPTPWNATLMSWLPGRILGRYLSTNNIEKLGRLFAQLHEHGATWTPPSRFTKRRFEHWLSRGEPNLLIGNASDAGPAIAATIPESHLELLWKVHTCVEEAYAEVERSDLRVIHCDLWHDNVKLRRGVLAPFDFEDTIWGFRAHDIAMAMLDLLEDTDDSRYPALLAAFRRGYESKLEWPNVAIEPFYLGRLLWIMNWTVRFRPDWLSNSVRKHVPIFENYFRTGTILQPNSFK